MRGDLHVASAGYAPARSRRVWHSWLSVLMARHRHLRAERLEVTERMAAERRIARRRGEYAPDLPSLRRW
jgi:Ser/Thr protein kinase RdoA (MazF antagonist)